MDTKSPYIHERLLAYRESIAFYRIVRALRSTLPRGMGPLGDQLSRAAQSVCLNIAEGAAARSRDVKRRHFNIALGSAAECSSALDLVDLEGGANSDTVASAREHLRLTTLYTLGLAR